MLRANPGDIGRIPEFQQNIIDDLAGHDSPVSVAALAEKEGVPTSAVVVALVLLELQGKVRRLPGEMYEVAT
jgi:predicted Rossmann fold nucleotide-binding protein DprA/Smf involved in DNA uptake